MAKVTPRQHVLLDEIKQDPKAYELLQAKCRWEGMGLHAVLSEWSDPRKWPSYVKDALSRKAGSRG